MPLEQVEKMDFTEVLKDTFTSDDMWAAILSSIVIIYLGYLLVKVKVLKAEWKSVINQVVLKVALPALALKGFMEEITIEDIKEEAFVFGFSILFYVFLLFISKYVFVWVREKGVTKQASASKGKESSDKILLCMMFVFGSTTFFGFPIVEAVYGSSAMIPANIFNIGYRIFLYSYCFQQMAQIKITKSKMKESVVKIVKNPVIIATFVGLTFWSVQLATPLITYKDSEPTTFFNLQVVAPWIYKIFSYVSSLCSPLVWISIGMTLANSKFKEAVKDKRAWLYCASKQVLLPTIGLGILLAFAQIEALNISATTISVIVILLATPPATVVIAYAMQFKRSENLAARSSVLSTICAVVSIPVWIFILDLLTQLLL